MSERGVAFTPEAARQVADVVRRVKAMPRNFPQQLRVGGRDNDSVVHVVEVTSTTPVAAGIYPARVIIITTPDNGAPVQAVGEDCYLYDPNG